MKASAVIGTVCLIVGLVGGAFAGQWFVERKAAARTASAVEVEAARARALEADVLRLQDRIELLELHLDLGRIATTADLQNYGEAGVRAARFFDAATRLVPSLRLGATARASLETVLERRDEVTAGLATAQPATARLLKEMFLNFQTAKAPAD
ncbi:MAG: hypothetical protein K8J08_20455 [Thermoanaerobaculia bacterium]|nr:hypothetical protein [Thermoanaerobaculia bacterium]